MKKAHKSHLNREIKLTNNSIGTIVGVEPDHYKVKTKCGIIHLCLNQIRWSKSDVLSEVDTYSGKIMMLKDCVNPALNGQIVKVNNRTNDTRGFMFTFANRKIYSGINSIFVDNSKFIYFSDICKLWA